MNEALKLELQPTFFEPTDYIPLLRLEIVVVQAIVLNSDNIGCISVCNDLAERNSSRIKGEII